MLGVVLLIVIVRDFAATAPVLSVTLKVKDVGPLAVVGVPEITPLELSVSPRGNVPVVIVQV